VLSHRRPETRREYGRRVHLLADHFGGVDPAMLCEAQVRDYFVFLIREKGLCPSSIRQARAAIALFFERVVGLRWGVFAEIKTKGSLPLPVVLSRAEVAALFAAVKLPRFRIVLRLLYGCGLRIGEALALEVKDVDGAGLRLHIREGKGGKPRYVPLPKALYIELRKHWATHRNPRFLFPALGLHWKVNRRASEAEQEAALAAVMRAAEHPMSVSAVQNVMRLSVAASGIKKPVCLHTLRHSYATHLLEEGVHIRALSAYLGHASLDTTMVYLHLTETSETRTQAALNALFA
jgi:integrase/recombinase XerD